MATLNVRREYADGDILLESDLDAFLDDIETFLNVTKLDDDNLQDLGITGSTKLKNASVTNNKMASNSVDSTQIVDDSVLGTKLAPAVAGDEPRVVVAAAQTVGAINKAFIRINNILDNFFIAISSVNYKRKRPILI